ncbi:MAG TPA: isochorismatase family protein [Acidimicrobiia bacterium]
MPIVAFGADIALIVVDCQNDFGDPNGSLYVNGGEAVIDRVNAAVAEAAAANSPVFYTQDWHPEDTPHFAKDGGVWPVHCVAGTWGAEFHPNLTVNGPVVRKGSNGEDGYSGFTMRDPASGEETPTELEAMLRDAGVKQVVVTGLALDYCVMATALDAARLGFPASVPLELTAAVNLNPNDADAAIAQLHAAGVEVG